jgi:hypothetical protein
MAQCILLAALLKVQKRCIDAVMEAEQLADVRMAFVDGWGLGPLVGSASPTIAYGGSNISQPSLRRMLVKRLARADITLCAQPSPPVSFSQADFMRACTARLPFTPQ